MHSMGVKWYYQIKKGTQRVNGENIMMDVKVKIYNVVKYNMEAEKVAEVEYKNIKRFEVVTGERAMEIGNETDENSRDEYNEYLVITLEDGETSTFCNSHVDLFII